MANYLNSIGIAAFVLQYRLGPRYHHPVELEDAQRAIRMVRSHASEWHIAQDHIGVMGFSAGGHLAALLPRISIPASPAQRRRGPRKQPAGLLDPVLSGDLVDGAVDSPGLED